jgi:hypothetical protein
MQVNGDTVCTRATVVTRLCPWSIMSEQGVPVEEISHLIGHSNTRQQKRCTARSFAQLSLLVRRSWRMFLRQAERI